MVKIDGSLLVRSCTINAQNSACAKLLVYHPHSFLKQIGVGRLEVLWHSGLAETWPCRWRVLYLAETVLLRLDDGLAKASAEAASAAHRRSASERGLLRLLDEVGVDFIDEAGTLAEGEVAVAVALLGVAQSQFGHGAGDGHVE